MLVKMNGRSGPHRTIGGEAHSGLYRFWLRTKVKWCFRELRLWLCNFTSCKVSKMFAGVKSETSEIENIHFQWHAQRWNETRIWTASDRECNL